MSWGRWLLEAVYPKAGWRRVASYVGHRLRRLPDSSHKIARGIAVGVLVSFSPFFGLHFILAMLLALLLRGNVAAALLGTFFGNPLTFPFIAAGSLSLGHWILGDSSYVVGDTSIFQMFRYASADFWFNFQAIFTPEHANWTDLKIFLSDVFLPYLVGGMGPGIISATTSYFISQPLISAYQKRRKRSWLNHPRRRGKKIPKKTDDDE